MKSKNTKIILIISVIILVLGLACWVITSSLSKKETVKTSREYKIITDMRQKTLQNDGGSYYSIYYLINIDNKTVKKIGENYHANMIGTPTTEKKVLFTKKINNDVIKEAKKLIEEIINKEDINNSNNYSSYTIESSNIKKDIYNVDTIKDINSLLSKFDNQS